MQPSPWDSSFLLLSITFWDSKHPVEQKCSYNVDSYKSNKYSKIFPSLAKANIDRGQKIIRRSPFTKFASFVMGGVSQIPPALLI